MIVLFSSGIPKTRANLPAISQVRGYITGAEASLNITRGKSNVDVLLSSRELFFFSAAKFHGCIYIRVEQGPPDAEFRVRAHD